MSIFYCLTCDNYRDADDGCAEAANGLDLICVECMEDEEADLEDLIYAHGQEATL